MHHNGRYPAICDMTGIRGWDNEFVVDPYGRRVLRQHADKPHPLEEPFRVEGEKALPWTRGQQEPIFIEVGSVKAEDL
jgi:hypothetical protein